MELPFLLVLTIICSTISAQFQERRPRISNFQEFLQVTGKVYATEKEMKLRERLFLSKKSIVDKHTRDFNEGRVFYELALNDFSDLKLEEFLDGLTGRKRTEIGDGVIPYYKSTVGSPEDNVPESFDWRAVGGVSPVKFQGLECGACWSFSVTGAIEGHLFRKTGQLIPLSEQNLIDCAENFGNEGCDGGFQEYGFAYVLENGGIAGEGPYPYQGAQDMCMYNEMKKATQIEGYSTIPEGDEETLKKVVGTLGPVACSVNGAPDSFQLYMAGIYRDEACNEGEVNHSILVVGYGSENGEDYWIIKNSWTENWGEGGYMRLPRNANNFCGIATECSYPIV